MSEEKTDQGPFPLTDDEQPAAPEEATTDAPAEEPKTPKFKIFLDAEGKEERREPLGRGRPPQGSSRDDDGNLVCPHVERAIVVSPQYIEVDDEGNETSRTAKGRGRPKAGYEKQDDGPFNGHWIKVAAAPEESDEQTTSEDAASEASTEGDSAKAPEVAATPAPEVVVAPVEATVEA